jgi:hypothetical protein
MTEEIQGTITSDKVDTDNTNFATVKADQTCEEALIPRDDPFRQLNWQVTMEKGSVYNPQEEVGIYAEEVDCKYGVQIHGDVFGRNSVSIEYGGAIHSGGENDTIGARIVGSVISEGQVDVVEPTSKMDDWKERPVTVYGDIIGNHVNIEEPTIVYGCVNADGVLRVNAPTVVLGDVHSAGAIEASDLFCFSITGRDKVTLGESVAVVNPVVHAQEGKINITDNVGIFTPEILESIRNDNNIDAVGTWVLDVEAVWEHTLKPIDVVNKGEGQIASRAWRTAEEPDPFYNGVREMFQEMVESTRKNPPDIEEFRYAGIGSLADISEDGVAVEGDMVIGAQEKAVDEEDITEIDESTTVVDESRTDIDVDQSTTEVDKSSEVHDESTAVEDAVMQATDIGKKADNSGNGESNNEDGGE